MDRERWHLPPATRERFSEILPYLTLTELQEQLKWLDRSADPVRLTVVLVLDENFSGYLPKLIQRDNVAGELVLCAPAGHLPGWTSAGDLALHATHHGWRQISLYRDLSKAVEDVLQGATAGDRLVLLWPEWVKLQQV